MELYVDDRKVEPGAPPEARLGELLDIVKWRTGEIGRLIVNIACDGIDITGEHFAEMLAKPVASFTRIDMHTADPAELVIAALDTDAKLLDASEQAAQQVVDLLAQGKTGTAMPRLAECCQAWLQVHEGICNAIAMLNVDPETLDLGGKDLPLMMAEPLEQLKQLKESVEANDHVLLSDILTYEFPGAISAWRTLIGAVAARSGNKDA
jgi:hypothetical protein